MKLGEYFGGLFSFNLTQARNRCLLHKFGLRVPQECGLVGSLFHLEFDTYIVWCLISVLGWKNRNILDWKERSKYSLNVQQHGVSNMITGILLPLYKYLAKLTPVAIASLFICASAIWYFLKLPITSLPHQLQYVFIFSQPGGQLDCLFSRP